MNLAEAYPKEQARCRELLEQYRAIGPTGAFGHMMISQVLARADKAVAEGDVVAMLLCYKEMQGCK